MFRLEISAKKQGNSINVGMSYKSGQSVLSSLHGAYAKMKGNTPTGLRIKELCLVLIVFASTTIFLWAWEKTPLFTLWIPPQRHVVVLSSEMFINKSGNGTLSHSQKPGDVEDSSQTTRETNHTFVSNNLLTASNIHNPLQFSEKYKSWSPLAIKEECNYAKGKWCADSKRPLYSGFGCKQWLSEMWACRLTQRTDFSYESFRWQPDDCNMPEFDGAAVLKRMQNKTIALIGDSLGRQQFQSLMCMVTGGKNNPEVVDVGIQYGLIKAPGALRPDGWAYWFPHTNTTILYYWSATLCELEPLNITDPATQYAMHLDRPVTFLQQNLHRFDVLVLNTGHHWNRGKLRSNRWIMYVEGSPNTNLRLREIGNAKKFTIYSVVKWLDSQLPHHPKLKAFFRTTSPRHFFNGDWNSGGICDNTIPLARRNNFSQDNFRDPIAESAVKSTKVKLLDITGLSQLRDEAHLSRYSVKATVGVQDCLHWCLPGIPDSWNEILVAQI